MPAASSNMRRRSSVEPDTSSSTIFSSITE
jgi:hypothetical protein